MPNRRNQRQVNDRIIVRSVRRKQPDISKIAKAVIGLALQQAAREAEAQQTSLAEPDRSKATVSTNKNNKAGDLNG